MILPANCLDIPKNGTTTAIEKDKVARTQIRLTDLLAERILRDGAVRQRDAELFIHPHREAGAIEHVRSSPRMLIVAAVLRPRKAHQRVNALARHLEGLTRNRFFQRSLRLDIKHLQ